MAKRRKSMDSVEFTKMYGPFKRLTQQEALQYANSGQSNRIFAVISYEVPWVEMNKRDRPTRAELRDMGYDDPYEYTWLEYEVLLGHHIVNVEERYLAARPIPEALDEDIEVLSIGDFDGTSGNLNGTFAGLMSGGSGWFEVHAQLRGDLLRGDSTKTKSVSRKFKTMLEAAAYERGLDEAAGWMKYAIMLSNYTRTSLRIEWGGVLSKARDKSYKFKVPYEQEAFILGVKDAVGWDEVVEVRNAA